MQRDGPRGSMTSAYIHGSSAGERRRLIEQAALLAPEVLGGLDLGGAGRILELGCGVGAELLQLGHRWPDADLTGLERSQAQLAAARPLLAPAIGVGRVRLVRGDARTLPFAPGSFDWVLTIWLLEHVADPARVLAEAARVLGETGRLICVEVDNGSLAFEPTVPAIADWWRRFNLAQSDGGGDPFIGRRLAALASTLGFWDIRTETLPVVSSACSPQRRARLLDYLEGLLLSGADRLRAAGLARPADTQRLKSGFDLARQDAGISFRYFAVRLICRPPPGNPGEPDRWSRLGLSGPS